MIREIFQFNTVALGVQAALPGAAHLDPKHAAFCVKAFREEAKELEDEFMAPIGVQNIVVGSVEDRVRTVKSVDAALDTAYFAIGLLRRAGLTEEQAIDCFLAVHEANMTKKLGVASQRGDMGVADAVKPADFVPPERKIYKIIYGVEAPTEVLQPK